MVFASGLFGSDARIAIIVSDPMVKEGTLDDFGAAIQGESNPQTPLLKGCSATTRCFSRYLPRPGATLFVVTRPLVHNAMSILVPDRSIFIVKAGRAFSYGWKRGCRLKRNIPRNIGLRLPQLENRTKY